MTDRVLIIQPTNDAEEYWRRVDVDPSMVVIAERAAGYRSNPQTFAFSTIGKALDHANSDDFAYVIYTLRIDDPMWGTREMDA